MLVALNRAAAFGEAARWLLHDIRSPAQSLTLLTDLLGDPHANIAQTLRDSSHQLGRTLELLSRVVRPSTPLEPGPLSVRDSIDFIASLHQHSRTHVRLETDVDPQLPPAVGAEGHLEHALLNLVLNAGAAVRAGRDGRIAITARLRDGRIEILVDDNGPGVPSELAGQLFTPALVRWSGTRLSGAGLLVAREVLGIAGGTVELARGPGSGARFVASLPVWRRAPPVIA